MKFVLLVAAALCTVAGQATAQKVVPLPGVVPADVQVSEAATTADGKRIYVISKAGDLWLYDRASSTSTNIGRLPDSWYLNVAHNGQALAFTRNSENGREEFPWTIPLDAQTGRPTGPERRVTISGGDAPSISPDGRWLAFARDDSVGQTLTIVPLSGGPERALATMHAGISSIQWAPDGKALYFGVGAPRDHREAPARVLRVGIDGGTPTTITVGSNTWPGLSPNGQFLVGVDTGIVPRHFVADPSGKRLTVFELPTAQGIEAWGGSNLLIGTTSPLRRLRSYSIASGQSRLLVDTLAYLHMPAISPDGKRISLLRLDGPRSQLIVANVDGSALRRIPLAKQWGVGNEWSPNGQWAAYHAAGGSSEYGEMHAVEVATGRDVRVSAAGPLTRTFSPSGWLADSRRALYVEPGESTSGPSATRQFLVREGSVSGTSRLRRELTLAKDGFVWPVGDAEMIVRRAPGEATLLATIKAGGPEITLLPGAPGFVSIPSLSADGQWIAFRRNPAQNNNSHLTVLEVVQRDGTHRTTMTLPFPAAPGFDSPHFLPGNEQLIIAEDASQSNGGAVYLVTLADKSIKKLFALPNERNRNLQQFAVTPDGKTILYLTTDHVPVEFGLMAVPTAKR